MRPWRPVRVTDIALRQPLNGLVEEVRVLTARAPGERGDAFMCLKVQGLLAAAEVLAVSLADSHEKHTFGRPRAAADGPGIGRLRHSEPVAAGAIRGPGHGRGPAVRPRRRGPRAAIAHGAKPIALLCLGSVAQFYAEPLWAEAGWARRQPLEMPVFDNAWGQANSLFPGESTR
ncbi:conserved hypothetical nitroreductase [Acidovorax delafieldii 2AN]|uniref:Conserved hypothetical nitroreductase n=1 Tax=Acidovorax delafieldii 2AN TaxID=573060 RepID=C5TC33_ACIDE|nr:conserved hypothetical nitroreductase [Acidovorax delafieldii 2AN]